MEYLQAMWDGPGHLRFIIQPMVAMLLAARDGRLDAQAGASPYILSIFQERAHPGAKLRQLVQRLTLPLCLAFGIDLVLQAVIRGQVRPLYSVAFACVFVVLPYAVVRALTNRAVSPRGRRRARA